MADRRINLINMHVPAPLRRVSPSTHTEDPGLAIDIPDRDQATGYEAEPVGLICVGHVLAEARRGRDYCYDVSGRTGR